ncbi:MAG: hypothetical protein AAF492_23685 [Verrucomicrobiota bacterium]
MESKQSKKNLFIALAVIVALLVVVFVYPRFLVNTLGKENPWTSYLYLYGFGTIFFSCGIVLILKTGSCKFGRGRDSFWFKVLLVGLLFFISLHGLWILAALKVPFLGDS